MVDRLTADYRFEPDGSNDQAVDMRFQLTGSDVSNQLVELLVETVYRP